MEKGRKAARIGLDSENDIIFMVSNDEDFRVRLEKCLMSLGYTFGEKIRASKDGISNRKKTDVLLRADTEIGVSIKSSTKTSFHQLDRRRLEVWRQFLKMPDDIFETIKQAVLRVAKDPNAKFILETDRNTIGEFFAQHLKLMLDEVLVRGEQNLMVLMINDKITNKIYVYRMRDVLDFLFENAKNNIWFTDKGIIKLGDFVSVQRKGGNGKRVKINKHEWTHPGNELQLKFSPLEFARSTERTGAIKFCAIDG